MRSLLRIWPVLVVAALWCWLYFPGFLFLPRGTIAARDQEIRELRDDLARAAVTTGTLPDDARAAVEAKEGEVRIAYRPIPTMPESVRLAIGTIPVEGSFRITIPEDRGAPEIDIRTRGWCFRPKAVLGFTTDKSGLPGVGARLAFFGDGGLVGLALWAREDWGILPDYVGAEIDWRLRRLGMKNTAVGIGGMHNLNHGGSCVSVTVGVFF